MVINNCIILKIPDLILKKKPPTISLAKKWLTYLYSRCSIYPTKIFDGFVKFTSADWYNKQKKKLFLISNEDYYESDFLTIFDSISKIS